MVSRIRCVLITASTYPVCDDTSWNANSDIILGGRQLAFHTTCHLPTLHEDLYILHQPTHTHIHTARCQCTHRGSGMCTPKPDTYSEVRCHCIQQWYVRSGMYEVLTVILIPRK